jgi:quercetin dioxygenase-like cupin family protein
VVGIEVTRNPVVVRRGTTDGTPLGSSGRARLKVYNQPQGDTGYALIEGSHPAGEPRIRDHVHARHEETFLVVEGEYQMRLGDEVVIAHAGDYVFVPRGTAHSYRNLGPGSARMLNIMSPADGVELLVELGALAGGTVEEGVLTEVHARHSAVLVDPLPGW